MATMREASRVDYTSGNTTEHLKLGALQRIADATENMAGNYTRLQSERDELRRLYRERGAEVDRLVRQIASLRGVITKQKKAAKEAA
jgi:hypothetical protein